jgi:hypothetical protein
MSSKLIVLLSFLGGVLFQVIVAATYKILDYPQLWLYIELVLVVVGGIMIFTKFKNIGKGILLSALIIIIIIISFITMLGGSVGDFFYNGFGLTTPQHIAI